MALYLASEIFPKLNVNASSKQLDRMVAGIRQLTKGSPDPDYRIRAMNTYLYKHQGFHYDMDDPYTLKLKNLYLNGILETKSGSCTTMPLLYLALAQRLKYPVYPVAAPQHLFCRYIFPDGRYRNIEATSGGGWSPDADYITDTEIPQQGIEEGAYLATMTYQQLVGDLIAENASYWARQRQYLRAAKYYTIATRLNPKAAEVWRLQGYAFHHLARQARQMEADLPSVNLPAVERIRSLHIANRINYQRRADHAFQTAEQLGVAPPLQANYWVRQKELARVASHTPSQQEVAP